MTTQTETETATKTDVIRRGIFRELPVPLEARDRLARAIVAAKKRDSVAEVEEELTKAKDEAKERIAKLEAELAELDKAVRTGEEPQLVECFERFHAGVIELVREDTKEVVDSRKADHKDLQVPIGGVEPATEAHANADAPKGNGKANGKAPAKGPRKGQR